MRIAVTGGTGFIGRYLLRQLASEGHQLHTWYRETSDRSGLDDLAESLNWVPGQLGPAEDAAALVDGCDAVVHGALYRPGSGFGTSDEHLLEFCEANILGTLQLIQAARKAGVDRFVFISTCAVHERILDDRPLDETHPTWNASHYGAHKAAIEQFVYSFGLGHGYPICALRPTGVYGIDHPLHESKWFDLVSRVVRGDSLTCDRGGKEVHAADVAKAVGLLLSADQERVRGAIFNCYDRYVSHHEVASIAKRITGSRATIHGQATSPKHQIETDKIRSLGMRFGGQQKLEATIETLVKAQQSS